MALSCSLHELPLPRMFVISTDDFLDLSEMRFVCWREGDDLATHVVITCDVGSLSVCLLFGIQSKPAIPCLLLRAFSEISKLFQIYPYLSSNIHLSSMYQRSPSSMYTKNLSESQSICTKRLQVLCVSRPVTFLRPHQELLAERLVQAYQPVSTDPATRRKRTAVFSPR